MGISLARRCNVVNLTLNGVNGVTGEYLTTVSSAQEVAQQARQEAKDREERRELAHWIDFYAPEQRSRGPKEGVDPLCLDQAGWGIILPEGSQAEALAEALSPLLELRRSQATDRHYRQLTYLPGESKNHFLGRYGAGPGPADPEKLPYYLLLVGDPEAIPFRFQYQLDVQYALGRLHFDTLEEYHQYAQSVLAAEKGASDLARRAVFFGVCNPDDPATSLSADHLVIPLADQFRTSNWEIRTCTAEDATKAELARVLGGEATPAFLFTACHGIGFPATDNRQRSHQGALLCQDWPGPTNWKGPILSDHFFSATDVGEGASLNGLIAFHFACYGAGTPKWDEFRPHQEPKGRRELAPNSFISQLPQRLLGHPRGGALAVIGHVDRAWTYSFRWDDGGRQLAAFESVVRRILGGVPVGFAMEYFNQRYAELSTDLSEELEDAEDGADDETLCKLWTARNDARNYVVLGDPAVRTPAIAK
jgi:hypothetical protein